MHFLVALRSRLGPRGALQLNLLATSASPLRDIFLAGSLIGVKFAEKLFLEVLNLGA